MFLVITPIHDGSNESSWTSQAAKPSAEIITKSLGHTLGNKRKTYKISIYVQFLPHQIIISIDKC